LTLITWQFLTRENPYTTPFLKKLAKNTEKLGGS